MQVHELERESNRLIDANRASIEGQAADFRRHSVDDEQVFLTPGGAPEGGIDGLHGPEVGATAQLANRVAEIVTGVSETEGHLPGNDIVAL